jgi:hypothetical protein
MAVTSGSLRVGHCYATALDEVRKIVEFDGSVVSYVVRGKLAFPTWDKKSWRSATCEAFAREVSREVPCDWRP